MLGSGRFMYFHICVYFPLASKQSLSSSLHYWNLLHRKTATSYRELEARKSRVRDLEKVYMDMAMQKELQVYLRLYLFRIQGL